MAPRTPGATRCAASPGGSWRRGPTPPSRGARRSRCSCGARPTPPRASAGRGGCSVRSGAPGAGGGLGARGAPLGLTAALSLLVPGGGSLRGRAREPRTLPAGSGPALVPLPQPVRPEAGPPPPALGRRGAVPARAQEGHRHPPGQCMALPHPPVLLHGDSAPLRALHPWTSATQKHLYWDSW